MIETHQIRRWLQVPPVRWCWVCSCGIGSADIGADVDYETEDGREAVITYHRRAA